MFADVRQQGPVSLSAKVKDTDTDHVEAELRKVAPFASAVKSPLDGSLVVVLSLDAKETWPQGIIQNSRHAVLTVTLDGRIKALQVFGRLVAQPKGAFPPFRTESSAFRACKAASIDAAIGRISTYIQKAKEDLA